MPTTDPFLIEIIHRFRTDKAMAEKAIAQLTDDELHRRPAPGVNSVAVIVRHVGGNLISRWTDFLTTDGEKPDRHRESEFSDWRGTRDELMHHWNRGFDTLFAAIETLAPGDLEKTITIRGEPHTVPRAVIRGLQHVSYHVGQILMLARMMHAGPWDYVTVAPGNAAR